MKRVIKCLLRSEDSIPDRASPLKVALPKEGADEPTAPHFLSFLV